MATSYLEPFKLRCAGNMHLDAMATTYGARSPTTSTASSSSSSLRGTQMAHSYVYPFQCTGQINLDAMNAKPMLQRPPISGGAVTTKERDSSSSRSPKTNNSNGGNFTSTFEVEHRSRNGNVTNHLPISSPVRLPPPASPSQYRRLESRRRQQQLQVVPKEDDHHQAKEEDSPKRQLPFNPGMTRKTAVTPRACRKAVVTEVRTDQARVVHQIAGRSPHGLPKFHLNEQPSGVASVAGNKCRSIHCKALETKRDTSQSRTSLNSHTISSLNKVVKSSMSSSNTSRDTSIESIVPKYKTTTVTNKSTTHEDQQSSAQKRSYNPQMLIRTNKFILNDEKVVSRKTNVIIPRIRTSLNAKRNPEEGHGGITHNIPIYRDLEVEKVSVKNAFNSLKSKENQRPTINGASSDQVVPPGSEGCGKSLWSRHRGLYEDCDTDFHKDPSNESLYIDFTKKRSPMTATKTIKKDQHSSPLRPINKDALLQRGDVTCEYSYQVTKQQTKGSRVSTRLSGSTATGAGSATKIAPSVFYVSCASWMPKCNNKFSLRERRLLDESKTISRKR